MKHRSVEMYRLTAPEPQPALQRWKFQITNPKSQTNLKFQIQNLKQNSLFEDFGLWTLGIVRNLVFGYWNFRCGALVGEAGVRQYLAGSFSGALPSTLGALDANSIASN